MKRLPPTCPPPAPRSKEEREDEFVNYLVKKALDLCIQRSRQARTRRDPSADQRSSMPRSSLRSPSS